MAHMDDGIAFIDAPEEFSAFVERGALMGVWEREASADLRQCLMSIATYKQMRDPDLAMMGIAENGGLSDPNIPQILKDDILQSQQGFNRAVGAASSLCHIDYIAANNDGGAAVWHKDQKDGCARLKRFFSIAIYHIGPQVKGGEFQYLPASVSRTSNFQGGNQSHFPNVDVNPDDVRLLPKGSLGMFFGDYADGLVHRGTPVVTGMRMRVIFEPQYF